MIQDAALAERTPEERLSFVHISDDRRFVDKLDIAGLESRLEHIVTHHAHVVATRLPQPVHDFEELEHKIVLSQIVTIFKQELLAHGLALLGL